MTHGEQTRKPIGCDRWACTQDCDEAQVSGVMDKWVLETFGGSSSSGSSGGNEGIPYRQTGAREDLAEARAAGRKLDGVGWDGDKEAAEPAVCLCGRT